jgi:hypothetical protein
MLNENKFLSPPVTACGERGFVLMCRNTSAWN